MSITAVAPEGIVTESFSTSAFWHKAERLLVVYYLYVRPGRGVAVEYAGFEFKGYDLHTWREVDRCRLEADWTTVREFVRTALEGNVDTEMPNLSTLVNPQLLYLDTSPKWPNRPRFRLKASLVTQMARERLDDDMGMIPDQGGLHSMEALRAYLHGISNTYAGQTLEDLAAPFNLPLRTKSGKENKSLAEQVVVRLFTGHAGKISQVPLFAKAGLVFKTMTLTPTGGRTEDMKLNPSISARMKPRTVIWLSGSTATWTPTRARSILRGIPKSTSSRLARDSGAISIHLAYPSRKNVWTIWRWRLSRRSKKTRKITLRVNMRRKSRSK